jgi:parallel beta helix pectate lyase-like protein
MLPTGAGTVVALIDDSRVNGNSGTGIAVQGASTLMLVNSSVSYNTTNGIRSSNGVSPLARVSNTTFTGNGTGVAVSSGGIVSYGDNIVDANGSNGAFSGVIQPKI